MRNSSPHRIPTANRIFRILICVVSALAFDFVGYMFYQLCFNQDCSPLLLKFSWFMLVLIILINLIIVSVLLPYALGLTHALKGKITALTFVSNSKYGSNRYLVQIGSQKFLVSYDVFQQLSYGDEVTFYFTKKIPPYSWFSSVMEPFQFEIERK